ncbi:MAG TPA: cupin domain-containing protein [Planctomycetota bacterium]
MIQLEGKTRVAGLREGPPQTTGPHRVWALFGRANGAESISLRTLEFGAGDHPWRTGDWDETWFILKGHGRIELAGAGYSLQPEDGLRLAPGSRAVLAVAPNEVLTVAATRCPEPVAGAPDRPAAPPAASPLPPHARLADQAVETTADRWYSVLIGKQQGSAQVTQFVGSIPPGRAPEHFHHYEEVLVILRGKGRMWAGTSHAPVGPGSCVFLPREQPHCLENLGSAPLVLMGTFYPSGSPAVSYATDG